MSTKIKGAEYPLAKIFSSDFDYEIPSFQRPYLMIFMTSMSTRPRMNSISLVALCWSKKMTNRMQR